MADLRWALRDFLTLDPRTVAQHHVGDVAGGRRREDRPGIASPDQARETADVVVMGVGDDHRVERPGVERELAVGAVGINPIGIKQPAVEQDPPGIDLQQMGAARDLSGRAMERDSQPKYLPTIDSCPAQRPRHPVHAGQRDRLRSRPIVLEPVRPVSPSLDVKTRTARSLLPVDDNHSIMPGTCDCLQARERHVMAPGNAA